VRIVYLLIGSAFLALSVFVMGGAFNLEYYTPLGPGPGFFPFWLAACVAFVTVLWLIQVYRRPSEPVPAGFFPAKGVALRLVSVLGALVMFTVFGEYLGFRITMLGFLVFLLFVLGHRSVLVVIGVALAGSFGAYYLFHDVMGVYLPIASIEFLKKLGL
jgi:putative tricarboxylic transport membrane protein